MQKVLIIGAGGIGSAVAREVVASGGRVFLAGRNPESLQKLSSELNCEWETLEATDAASVDACGDKAAENLEGVTGIVNCVGSILLKPGHLTSSDEWHETIAANLTTAFHCVRTAGRLLRSSGGSVVLLSSAAGRIGLANHEAVAAAKAGVIGLTRSAAATYARSKIRFNCVAPGLVRTPLAAGLLSSELAEKASVSMHPLGRIGEPEDVSSAVCWFLDPKNSWVTGQILGVDGGLADLKAKN
ncbi:MAG: SDR family oxidoreductase [Pirellulales bacterium]|nr:SDR family oxidoreductase [Pirellulales bacterium]